MGSSVGCGYMRNKYTVISHKQKAANSRPSRIKSIVAKKTAYYLTGKSVKNYVDSVYWERNFPKVESL